LVHGYTVLDVSAADGREWRAKLRVTLKDYRPPGFAPHLRRKLAVIPFAHAEDYPIAEGMRDGDDIARRLTQFVVTSIVQSRKFTVLDRENDIYYKKEKEFILSGDTAKDEYLKLGKRLGADYILIGNIVSFEVENEIEKSKIGIPDSSTYIGSIVFDYRILSMATQHIKWSQSISRKFTVPTEHADSYDWFVDYCLSGIADIIAEDILMNIYPPKVLKASDKSIVINYGAGVMKLYGVYDVYSEGERLVDPYTKEFLGYEEILSGKVQIYRVEPKVSYALLLEGNVEEGMVLRVARSDDFHDDVGSEGAKADTYLIPGGGVVLPFEHERTTR